MKMRKKCCLVLVICLLVMLFASCGNNSQMSLESRIHLKSGDVFCKGHVTDDMTPLADALTKEYDLEELKQFFEGRNTNNMIYWSSFGSTLSFEDVNAKYPVEIIRSNHYSVYRVKQGGYFYVFWLKSADSYIDPEIDEPTVFFSAYLSSDVSRQSFDTLTPGVSTAEDVKLIDPFFQLSFLSSSGTFSYSYLNDKTLLEIKYERIGCPNGYADLVVEEIKTISRDLAPSVYKAILPEDLP